ncbi:hypothetical protein AC249_AIPGENE9197 [Exaiptasia diaphana]|nr:hypothetical protein AC249_AIPGENE9197 [Exaiptasia diaphana]
MMEPLVTSLPFKQRLICYLVQFTVISSLGADDMVQILPHDSKPVASFALGHFAEDNGIHYVCLASNQEQVETDDDDGVSGSDDANVEDGNEESEGKDEYDGVNGRQSKADLTNSPKYDFRPFDELPDEILEIIVRFQQCDERLKTIEKVNWESLKVSESAYKKVV